MSEQNGKSQALAPLSPTAAPLARALEMDAARLALITRTIGADLKPDELQLFLAVAARTGLDPFLKQLYPIKDKGGRFFLHVGIEGRRVIAQRTGLVDGTLGPFWAGADGVWKDVWLADELPAAARFGVLKKGCQEPFYAVAHMKGFRGGTGRWQVDAVHMLGKVAEDHAWRRAFPYEMGAVPSYRPEHDDEAPDAGAASVVEHEATYRAAVADHEAQYRELDEETGEITETTRAPAGAASAVVAAADGPPLSAVEPRSQSAPATPADELDAIADASKPAPPVGRPAWWDTPLGKEISPLVDELDAAGASYSMPDDAATYDELRGWMAARRSWLKQRGQTVGAR